MQNSSLPISLKISTTNPDAPLSIRLLLDDTEILNVPHVVEDIDFRQTIDCPDGPHRLRILMDGKTFDHTIIDETGQITKDSTLIISDLTIDDIAFQETFYNYAVYRHDCNGSTPPREDRFSGLMGCNGEVEFEFDQPFYLWLLENI